MATQFLSAGQLTRAVWERLRAARWLWRPLAAFALTRFGILLVAVTTVPLVADSSIPPYHLRPDNVVLDVLGSRWDTGFYLDVAREGYRYWDAEQFPNVPFFPLLPLLIRALSPLVGDPVVAGVLATNAALLGAVLLLYRLVADLWGEQVAGRAVWYLLLFPTSFFGSAIYSEALCLLGAIAALHLARRGYWESAGLVGILAALSRLLGILVAPLLALEWWQQFRARPSAGQPRRPLWAALLAPAAVPLGTAGYMLYLQRAFGDPLAFLHASAAWGRTPRSPLEAVAELAQRPAESLGSALAAGHLPYDGWVDLAFVLFFLVLGLVLLVQQRWGEGVFVALGALIPLSSGLLLSQRRYVWVLFPAFVLLARWGERPWVHRLIVGLSVPSLALFTALFANWYWVA